MSPVDFDPNGVSLPNGHFIGGTFCDIGGASIAVRRPSDGQHLGSIRAADEAVIDEAVGNSRDAWENTGWASRSPRDRGRVLRRWAELIDKEALPLAQLEAVGSTRPVSHAYASDVHLTAETIRFFGELCDKVGGEVVTTRRDSLGMIVSEPYGVVAAITPWNFPLSMASWKCGPALAAGNAIVLKPSELTPFSSLRLAELALQAGVPPGIFNVVNGTGAGAGADLVRHPDIGKISFTGSTRTGAAIMSAAAASGTKPVTLELGGKSPQLVFAQVNDIREVARHVFTGFTANAGQACVAGTRLIVHRALADPLLNEIIALCKTIEPKPTWDAGAAYAPIISPAQTSRIQSLVDQSVAQGAELIVGGRTFDDMSGGCFYQPTLISKVTDDTIAVREELFGPVLTIQTFDDEAEGISLANRSAYGLAAGIYTSDIGQAMRAMRRIAAGTIWINRYGRSGDMMLTTGGFKQSGFGKDLGRQAIDANLRFKTVLLDFDARRQIFDHVRCDAKKARKSIGGITSRYGFVRETIGLKISGSVCFGNTAGIRTDASHGKAYLAESKQVEVV